MARLTPPVMRFERRHRGGFIKLSGFMALLGLMWMSVGPAQPQQVQNLEQAQEGGRLPPAASGSEEASTPPPVPPPANSNAPATAPEAPAVAPSEASVETSIERSIETSGAALQAVPNFWNTAAPPAAPQQVIRQLRFVTADDFPPFNFLDATDTLIGFNVDLARAICDAINAQCTMGILPFASISAALAEGSADIAVAGLSPEAHPDLLFSKAYFALPARFVARQDSDLEGFPEALIDQQIGVVAGSQHEAFLKLYFPQARHRAFETPKLMRQALAAREVPIIFDDAVTASYWLGSRLAEGCCKFASGPYLTPTHFGDGLMLATVPQKGGLLEAVEYALYRVFETGRYSEIYLRYFPLSPF